ncbi:MAG TPA: GNAT family N-acetyltransferase [Candidatus Limnocylindria bacterium]|nr:GNAT family N-acetyltransferase [Candidatus Limnocylindria bacterium]
MTGAPLVRRARPEEADELTALALRSKAHWGYDEAFMQASAATIVITAASVELDEVWVLEEDARPVGVYRVVLGGDGVAELEDLWVDREAIGEGRGRRLFEHAAARAKTRGASALEWDADPNALGFYQAMGGQAVGETESSVRPGRMLPRMRLALDGE